MTLNVEYVGRGIIGSTSVLPAWDSLKTLDAGSGLQDVGLRRRGDRLFYDQDGPGGRHAISPNDVRQGSVGNCYLLAALAAIAKTNPSYIQNLIRPISDDRWAVTLYETVMGPTGRRQFERRVVIVSRDELLAKGALSMSPSTGKKECDLKGNCGGKELWVSIIETAYHKMKSGDGLNGDLYPGMGFEALTGVDHLLKFVDRYTPTEVKRLLLRGEAIVVVSGRWDRWFSGKSQLPESHVMMVKDVLQGADAQGKPQWIYVIYDQASGREVRITQAQLEAESMYLLTSDVASLVQRASTSGARPYAKRL